MPSATNHTTFTFQSTSPNHMFGILKSQKTIQLSKHESVFCLTSGIDLQFTPTKKQTKKRTNKKTSNKNNLLENLSDCTTSEISQDSTMSLIISQHVKPQTQFIASPQQTPSISNTTCQNHHFRPMQIRMSVRKLFELQFPFENY